MGFKFQEALQCNTWRFHGPSILHGVISHGDISQGVNIVPEHDDGNNSNDPCLQEFKDFIIYGEISRVKPVKGRHGHAARMTNRRITRSMSNKKHKKYNIEHNKQNVEPEKHSVSPKI